MADLEGVLRARLSARSRLVDAGDGSPGLWHETPDRPAVRVECGSAEDVTTVLHAAAEHELPVHVWGGRRDIFARNAGDGAVVVDLRRMNRVRFDTEAGTLTVGGGSTMRDALDALPADRATVTTANPDVGMIGAATGGGYGPLVPRLGLMADQLTAARIVLADGTEAVAGAEADADAELLWAMRGGGTGFGVVREATFATARLGEILNAIVVVPPASAARALTTVQRLLDDELDQLAVLPLFGPGPDGDTALFLLTHWTGDERGGASVLAALTGLPGAATAVEQRAPYRDTFSSDEDGLWPPGYRWAAETRTVPRLDEIADVLVDGARTMPGPMARLFLHDFHGAATRVPAEISAFPLRADHFVVCAAGAAAPGDRHGIELARDWAEAVSANLSAHSLPGGYINFLAPAAADRVTESYGPSGPRLESLRDRVDPGRLFRGTTGIRDAAIRQGDARGAGASRPDRNVLGC